MLCLGGCVINVDQTRQEKIRQRRAQMLIHSCIYYHLDDSIVSDHTWQRWADELCDLQCEHKEGIGYYDEDFEGWDGSSGFNLPLRHPAILGRAQQILEHHNNKRENNG